MDEAHTGRLAYFEQDLWIPALVRSRGVRNVLPRHDFTGCVLAGPAVVSLIECDLHDCQVVGAVEMLPWPRPARPDPADVPADGVIRMFRCTFTGCVFDGVGFAAAPAHQPALRARLPVADAAPPRRRRRGFRQVAG